MFFFVKIEIEGDNIYFAVDFKICVLYDHVGIGQI